VAFLLSILNPAIDTVCLYVCLCVLGVDQHCLAAGLVWSVYGIVTDLWLLSDDPFDECGFISESRFKLNGYSRQSSAVPFLSFIQSANHTSHAIRHELIRPSVTYLLTRGFLLSIRACFWVLPA